MRDKSWLCAYFLAIYPVVRDRIGSVCCVTYAASQPKDN